MFFNWCGYSYFVYTLLCLTKCGCEERIIKHNVLRVYVRWCLEALTFQYSGMFDRRTNVE